MISLTVTIDDLEMTYGGLTMIITSALTIETEHDPDGWIITTVHAGNEIVFPKPRDQFGRALVCAVEKYLESDENFNSDRTALLDDAGYQISWDDEHRLSIRDVI